jgi:hypothetical protein
VKRGALGRWLVSFSHPFSLTLILLLHLLRWPSLSLDRFAFGRSTRRSIILWNDKIILFKGSVVEQRSIGLLLTHPRDDFHTGPALCGGGRHRHRARRQPQTDLR